MTPEQRAEILKGAKEAFFAAMLDGWAGGENRRSTKTNDAQCYTTFVYMTEDGKFAVVDRFCTTTLSDKSGGTTTIFIEDEGEKGLWLPVWWMAYGGEYPEGAINFLRQALRQNYEKGVFLGGRGPESLASKDNYYWNSLRVNFGFEEFEGCEKIFEKSKSGDTLLEKLGFHKYFGMAMI